MLYELSIPLSAYIDVLLSKYFKKVFSNSIDLFYE